MAKSKNLSVAIAESVTAAGNELPAVVTLEARIASHVAAIVDADKLAQKLAKEAVEAIGKAQNHSLTTIVKSWAAAAPINGESFDATVNKPRFDSCKLSNHFKGDKAIQSRMSQDKVAIIAITNGILPVAGEVLRKFYERVGPSLKTTMGPDGKPLIKSPTGTNGGRKAKEPSVSDADAGKAQEMSRTMALNVLCAGDEPRMAMIEFLTNGAHWGTIAAVYASLNPIKIK